MPPLPSTSPETIVTIGTLCAGGDRACADGDFSELREVAGQLAAFMPEPVHCALVELGIACLSEPARAVTLWNRLKDQLYREARP